jgi:hypothetical protein
MWWGFGQREAHQRDMYGLWWRGEEEDTMAKGADLFSWRGSPQTMQLNGLLFLDFGEMLEGREQRRAHAIVGCFLNLEIWEGERGST